MRRIATALCAAGVVLALLAPGTASAAFGPVGDPNTFGGPGSGNGQFNHPQAAAVGPQGQIYVADTNNARLQAFNSSWAWTNNLTAPGNPAPLDVAVTANNLIFESSNGRVDRWSFPLNVPLHLGSFSAAGAYGIAVDPSGAVYVSDKQGGVIRRYDATGGLQGTFGAGQLSQPEGMTADASGIYVADPGNARIVKFTFAGDLAGVWNMPRYTIVANGSTFTGTVQPHDVAVGASGNVFAPDAGTNSNLVAIFNAGGSLLRLIGAPASDPNNACRVSAPWGVATSGGTLFVVSTGENKIRVFGDNAPSDCPTVNFGSGGGVDRGGGSGGGGAGATAGAVSDRTAPTVSFSGFPKKKKCARKNFAIVIHAQDDVLLRKLTLFVNHRRTDSQLIYKQYWDVTVRIPVRKVRRALPRGTKVRVLIGVRVIDQSGKTTWAKRGFKICG